jgi:hypothetical protein
MRVELDVVYHNPAAAIDVRVVENPASSGSPKQARYHVEWSPAGARQWQCVGYANSFKQAALMLALYRRQRARPR